VCIKNALQKGGFELKTEKVRKKYGESSACDYTQTPLLETALALKKGEYSDNNSKWNQLNSLGTEISSATETTCCWKRPEIIQIS